MAEALTIDFSQPVPVFPLPNCLLLPHATIPLHIFEPRYRRMVNDALDSRGLIAMAVFNGDAWKDDYEGKPPLRSHVCIGYIVKHQRVADGRYNILLQGVCRAKILEEIPHDTYRVALLEPTEHQPITDIQLDDERARLENLLDDPVLKELAAVSAIHNWLSDEIPTAALIDLALMHLCDDMEKRYEMLMTSDPTERAQLLEKLLCQARRSLKIVKRFAGKRGNDDERCNRLHFN